MSSASYPEMMRLNPGTETGASWTRVAVCGAVGMAAAVMLLSSTSSSSFLMTSVPTTSVRTLPAVQYPGSVQPRMQQRASHTQTYAVRAPTTGTPSVEVVSDPVASSITSSPMGFTVVAALSAMFGAFAMHVFGTKTQEEPAPIATAWTTGLKEPSRGDRMILGAAKGKGGNAKPIGMIKLALPAGKATAAPPVGPALGQYGLNIVAFCKDYNARTEKEAAEGLIIPVEITAFDDRSFTFILKTPPASVLLKKYAGISAGSGEGRGTIVGKITKSQLEEIAKIKLPDLNTNDVQMAMNIVGGTARNMGIEIVE